MDGLIKQDPEKVYLFGTLKNIQRCPHCGVAKPLMERLFTTASTQFQTGEIIWALYRCATCDNCMSVKGIAESWAGAELVESFPAVKNAALELPERAHRYLQQAYETLHAPDAATVMSASSIDAMLKASGYKDGSLYSRINKAVEDGLLTKNMGEWAHSIRLESNRPRHADEEDPHITEAEAKQVVEFAEALGYFLFELPAQIQRGTATVAEPNPSQESAE